MVNYEKFRLNVFCNAIKSSRVRKNPTLGTRDTDPHPNTGHYMHSQKDHEYNFEELNSVKNEGKSTDELFLERFA
jgi:hypothetical protein